MAKPARTRIRSAMIPDGPETWASFRSRVQEPLIPFPSVTLALTLPHPIGERHGPASPAPRDPERRPQAGRPVAGPGGGIGPVAGAQEGRPVVALGHRLDQREARVGVPGRLGIDILGGGAVDPDGGPDHGAAAGRRPPRNRDGDRLVGPGPELDPDGPAADLGVAAGR